jgi:hypothetical protein
MNNLEYKARLASSLKRYENLSDSELILLRAECRALHKMDTLREVNEEIEKRYQVNRPLVKNSSGLPRSSR